MFIKGIQPLKSENVLFMTKKVLLFGPYSAPVTGQQIAFSQIVNAFLPQNKTLIDTTKFTKVRFFTTIYIFFSLFFKLFSSQITTVYFTCSRSKRGFVKDLFLLVFCRIKKVKVINHLHGADFTSFYEQSNTIKRLINWSYQIIDTHIVLLEEMREQFYMFPHSNIQVVSNAYPKVFIDRLLDLKDRKNQVIYFSNIMASKGIFEFLEVAKNILEKNEKVTFSICGLPMSDQLLPKNMVEKQFLKAVNTLQNKFSDRIQYLGLVEGKEKVSLLYSSSIFVLPTYYISEAVPISIIEAMKTGNAIVTTKHNYLPCFLNSENGVLVDPKAVDQLQKGIELFLNDSEKLEKVRQNNIKQAEELYSGFTCVRKVLTRVHSQFQLNL